ncbi:MAPEG family protein [Undibacterium sp. Ren11W]
MDSAQRGVAIGAAAAFLMAAVLLALAAIFGAVYLVLSASLEFRLKLLAVSLMAPAATLFICIARLAQHRFFTPEDINGSGLTEGSSRAWLLQALLQNTLEQLALALPVYFACAIILPSHFLALIPAAAAMFFVGRLLFYIGYAGGAASRAFGFAFTFYPTVFLGCGSVYFLLRP